MESKDLRGIVRALIEARIRETDITDGRRVQFGSTDHVSDLENRISDLERWRDRQRRGSEARANYSRLISQLKRELRSALRVNDPKPASADPMDATAESAPVAAAPLESAIAEADKPKKVVHWEHTRGTGPACSAKAKGSRTSRKGEVTCSKCKKAMSKERMNEGIAGWTVVHREDGVPLYGVKKDKAEAESIAATRNNVAMNGAWGKQNPGAEPPYIVVPYEDTISESVDMEDPEYTSLEDFVQFLLDDERDTYTHEDLAALNFRTRMPINSIRKELEGYGFKLAVRAPVKQVRGFTSSSHDRWYGKGSLPTHGGAGIDAFTGRATVRGRTI